LISYNYSESPDIEFKIKAVGDICPGDKFILGLGICSLMKKHGADFPLRNVRDMFDDADIVIGNLEGLLSRRIENNVRPDITFCGLPEFALELKKLGFNVINVANNHIFEYGRDIFQETVSILHDAGLKVCGLRDNESDYYSQPVFVEKNGKQVGIIGYNWVGKDKFPKADQYIAQSHDSIVNYTWNRNKLNDKKMRQDAHTRNRNVIHDIRKLKEHADYVILIPHWGYEFVNYPPYGVTVEAKTFIDAGADLIIGAHPHVLQGMEQYKGKWIFYSLGNFIFDMRPKRKYSVILNYFFNKNGNDKHYFDYLMLNQYFQPSLASTSEEKNICKIIKESNKRILAANKESILDDDKIYKEFETIYQKGKLKNILEHFKLLPFHPMIIKIIHNKFMTFLKLLALRMKGKKIRW
jgi:poly-gamma-glutamate synthesis protein (capsule biosynthesis protein)